MSKMPLHYVYQL